MITTLSSKIETAKRLTNQVAEMKDYQVRNKQLRQMREEARKLADGKGYIIDNGRICAYYYNKVWRKIEIVSI